MGETVKTPDLDLRRRFLGLVTPGTYKKMVELETQLVKLEQERVVEREVNGQNALKLQRATQQLNHFMKDVGVQRDRWALLSTGDYNPDEISMTEYKKMLNYDANVIAGFDLIKMGVLMKPWKIVHPDKEIRTTITNALNQMTKPTFRDACKEMMKAIAYGYSVTETVFADYKGKFLMPRKTNGLKTFDPETITFFSDPYGNLEKVEQLSTSLGTVTLPLDRTLVWTHEKEYGSFYGVPMLRGCYSNWFIKQAMLKFCNISYERFGSPILLGTARDDKQAAMVLEALEHVYARSQAVITKHDKDDPAAIEVLESKRAEMPFQRYIDYQDNMILRRMLIGQRIFEGGGGVYGPKVPMDLILMRFEDFRLELQDTLNQLMQVITDLNWNVDSYPTVEFEPLVTADKEYLKNVIWEAIEREIVPKDASWIRTSLGLPEEDKDHPRDSEKDSDKAPAQEEEKEEAAD